MTSFNDDDNLNGDIDLDDGAQDPSLDVDNSGADTDGTNHEDDTNDGPTDANGHGDQLGDGVGDADDSGVDDGDPDQDSGDDDNGVPQVPGKIPDNQSQDDDQTTRLHQALLYVVRALQELSSHVAELETNYAPLAIEAKQFLSSYVGRLETVWQNGQLQPSSDQLDSDTRFGHDPSGQHRQVF